MPQAMWLVSEVTLAGKDKCNLVLVGRGNDLGVAH
jgi:hypothetical protein